MELAFSTHDVRRVLYGIDLDALSYFYKSPNHETPNYLYDDDLLNDVAYWFNAGVLAKYIPPMPDDARPKRSGSGRHHVHVERPVHIWQGRRASGVYVQHPPRRAARRRGKADAFLSIPDERAAQLPALHRAAPPIRSSYSFPAVFRFSRGIKPTKTARWSSICTRSRR